MKVPVKRYSSDTLLEQFSILERFSGLLYAFGADALANMKTRGFEYLRGGVELVALYGNGVQSAGRRLFLDTLGAASSAVL